MRALVQRVSNAKVVIDNDVTDAIERGYLILLGIEVEDSDSDVDWLVRKICGLRVFSDAEGRMNLALGDIDGEVLVISQFTLHASYKKGNRPGFTKAARPETAVPLYESFIQKMEAALGKRIGRGRFGADMKVHLVNDGPVTILVDTKHPE